jgi:hypothetical protein
LSKSHHLKAGPNKADLENHPCRRQAETLSGALRLLPFDPPLDSLSPKVPVTVDAEGRDFALPQQAVERGGMNLRPTRPPDAPRVQQNIQDRDPKHDKY